MSDAATHLGDALNEAMEKVRVLTNKVKDLEAALERAERSIKVEVEAHKLTTHELKILKQRMFEALYG